MDKNIKVDIIRKSINTLMKISNKFSRIEEMPIILDDKSVITTKEIHTIQAIGEKNNINITDLAEHFGITKSAASQFVKKLENKKYIEKNKSNHSKKEFELSLTEKGKEAFKKHEEMHGSDLQKLINNIMHYSEEEIKNLYNILNNINNIMDERLK